MFDNKVEIYCPACGKKMKKIFVPSAGVNVDICVDGCGGIYFDNRELEKFDEEHENIDVILNALEGKTFKSVDENSPRICPVCGAKMVKNYSSINKTVQIDECYGCGGKFLDNGELVKIRKEYPTEEARSAAAVNALYDVVGAQLKEFEAENEAARREKSFVQKIFKKMIYG